MVVDNIFQEENKHKKCHFGEYLENYNKGHKSFQVKRAAYEEQGRGTYEALGLGDAVFPPCLLG